MAKQLFGIMDKLDDGVLYFNLVDSKGNPVLQLNVKLLENECPVINAAMDSLVVEIEYGTYSKGKLNKSKFKRFRTDKNVLECSINQLK